MKLLFVFISIVSLNAYSQELSSKYFYTQTDCIDKGLKDRNLGIETEICANTALEIAPAFKDNWNYGNAIHKSYTALGLIEITRNNVTQAEHYLISSALTRGSPQLNSFGPNMRLAKALLEQNRTESVLKYLDLCRKFWNKGELDQWYTSILVGEMPDFGPNLKY